MTTPAAAAVPTTDAAAPAVGATMLTGAIEPAAGAAAVDPKAAAPVVPAVDPKAPPAAAAAVDPKAAVVEPIAIKFPEGVKADDPVLSKFEPLVKELGLKGEGAQKIVDLFGEYQKGQNAQAQASLEKIQRGWAETLKADKEFGGADFDKNAQVARKAIVKYGDEELRKVLEETGLGNHPAVVRAFFKAGKALGEDSISGTTGSAAKTPATSDEAHYRALYTKSPQMFPKE